MSEELPPIRSIESDEEQEGARHTLQLLEIFAAQSGPLPPPEVLEEYRRVLTDAPERIMRMAEKNQELMAENVRETHRTNRLQIRAALAANLALGGIAAVGAWQGSPAIALPFGILMVGPIVRFISSWLSRFTPAHGDGSEGGEHPN